MDWCSVDVWNDAIFEERDRAYRTQGTRELDSPRVGIHANGSRISQESGCRVSIVGNVSTPIVSIME